MSSAMLPSLVSEAREQRIRAIRRVLAEHERLEPKLECMCGWTAPRGLAYGNAAYRAHLAEVIVDVL
jgi:hypothetical protein